jgi:penicillin-binding protein 2
MIKAIAESCNVYFYTIGGGYGEQEGLGPSRIKKYLELFGWGNNTDIDLPGEKKGLLPSPAWKERVKKEKWWDGDTYHLSIGQGDILTTPLQVASAFSVIANGGKLFKPHVVQKILDTSTGSMQVVKEIEPEVIRENFIDSKNLDVVRHGMREAVIYGSSVSLNNLPVKAAAKTGTAQTSKQGYYHHWVTVFAPYDDPEIVLTVMLENVKEIQFAALPVAKEVLEWYFTK